MTGDSSELAFALFAESDPGVRCFRISWMKFLLHFMEGKQEAWPPLPLLTLPPSSSYIKEADGRASAHSVNPDMSRHESGGRTGAGAGSAGPCSL